MGPLTSLESLARLCQALPDRAARIIGDAAYAKSGEEDMGLEASACTRGSKGLQMSTGDLIQCIHDPYMCRRIVLVKL